MLQRVARACATILVAVPSVLALAAPSPAQLDEQSVPWTALDFAARKLGFSMRASLEIDSRSAEATASELVAAPEGKVLRPEGPVEVIRLRSGFLGRNSDITTLVEARDGRALQQEQVDSGKRQRHVVSRYCEEGVYTLRRVPNEGEEKLPQESWSGESSRWEAYPTWVGDDLLVTDTATLFYLAAAAPLHETGDRLQIPVFTGGNLVLLEMTVRSVDRVNADYESVSESGSSRVRGSVDALRISLDAQHLDPDSREEDLEIMGLVGDVEMVLERAHRLPLELSGRMPYVGKVTVRLGKAKLRQRT